MAILKPAGGASILFLEGDSRHVCCWLDLINTAGFSGDVGWMAFSKMVLSGKLGNLCHDRTEVRSFVLVLDLVRISSGDGEHSRGVVCAGGIWASTSMLLCRDHDVSRPDFSGDLDSSAVSLTDRLATDILSLLLAALDENIERGLSEAQPDLELMIEFLFDIGTILPCRTLYRCMGGVVGVDVEIGVEGVSLAWRHL